MNWNGTKIKSKAKEQSMAISRLAEAIGVSRQTVSDWTKGQIPKGNHLVSLCQILKTSPNYFFEDIVDKSIFVPAHRARRKAKITLDVQNKAFEMAKEYSLFFRSSSEPDIVPVARVTERTNDNIIKIAKYLRNLSGLEDTDPINYTDAFKLVEGLGINVIFKNFPETIKSYAFYTRIHNHRVVFVNNSTNVIDLIFQLLHESVHAIRDEIEVADEYDKEEEDFCDQVANNVQFTDEYVRFVYTTIKDSPVGHQINNLKAFGQKYGHSLYGISSRIKELDTDFTLNVGGADTNLKKKFHTIGEVLFAKEDPCEYINILYTLSPNFVNKILLQLESISYRRLADLLDLDSVLDAKLVKQELAKLIK
ncbi:MAG: XRE family transcriptional regulator [bacterium]|nr:XRE family transcriptional regulator [bacterium]